MRPMISFVTGTVMLFGSLTVLSTSQSQADAIIADHTSVAEFDLIPDSTVQEIGADFHIYYVHTSHGSQIMSGLSMVYNEDNLYAPPYFYEYGDDLGHNGDTSWAPNTRSYLNAHPECNMAMFSWCGGCSENTEAGINFYLNKMAELEATYPAVIFIYMTGHLDGTGVDGNLYARNDQIRAWCSVNDKILFDFADIESYDPNGVYYPDESDACNWCYDWCAVHTCQGCPGSCAHSHCFNCYLKGRAWWWMMAQVVGGSGGDGCCMVRGDMDHSGGATPIDISDLVYLVDYMFTGGPVPVCFEEGDVDAGGTAPIDIADLVYLVDFMFNSGPPPAVCE